MFQKQVEGRHALQPAFIAKRCNMKHWLTLISAIAITSSPLVHAAGDAKHGKELYESRCIGCHSIDENRAGPAHRGVYGRKAGSAPGYDYSAALKKSKVIWNAKTLNKWLTDPEQFIPGQKMGISVADAQDRKDLIAYLKSQK
jgi:cytochrome c